MQAAHHAAVKYTQTGRRAARARWTACASELSHVIARRAVAIGAGAGSGVAAADMIVTVG
jgi:hypothetical protein